MTPADLHDRIAKAVARFPEGKSVRRVRLFGSRITGEERAGSDYDFIVDLEPALSLFGLSALKRGLEKSLGAKVDLMTPGGVHPVIRKRVLHDAVTVYEG